MDPTSDEQPSAYRSRRLSRRQMEKAPEGIIEEQQEQQNRHSPDHVDRGRLSSPRLQQQQQQEDFPPTLPSASPGPRFANGLQNGIAHENTKKGATVPSHVGGRHFSPPPPHADIESDGEEGVTGDGDGDDRVEDEDEDEEEDQDDDDIYTDDVHQDVGDRVRSTEPGAPETKAVHTDSLHVDGEGYEHGVSQPTKDVPGDELAGEGNAPTGGAGEGLINTADRGEPTEMHAA